jgi:L-2-hydroxyglutarate oxidase LhgO
MEIVPYTVIGGGICGIWVALKLKMQFPESEVVLIEKEPYMGHHSTTRNSGVLHAGLYYKTGSLKHLLCRAGYEEWLRVAPALEVPLRICGKYVIAGDPSEVPELERILANAKANGVPGIRPMSDDDQEEISEFTHMVAGFYSPLTGILDISTAINRLRDEFVRLGGILLLRTEVSGLSSAQGGVIVHLGSDALLAQNLVNCGGAWGVDLRKMLGLTDVENLFVKGNYLKLNKPYYNKRLIYPVPQKNLTGLGVHTSFHMDGFVRFGPNTEAVSEVDYINGEKNIELMYPAIQAKFKNIAKSDLSLDYAGVRSKILRGGELYTDFLIQGPAQTGVSGYSEALGIESPGLTAAPAIADYILKNMFTH